MLNISLTDMFLNKKAIKPRAQGDDKSFVATEISVRGFIKHVLGGGTWAVGTYEGDHRHKSKFIQSGVLALDLDTLGVSVPKCLENAAISRYAALVHPTPTSSPTHRKTRIIFVLDKPIIDGEQWELAQRACLHYFADLQPDASCKNRSRQYHGCNRGEAHERPDTVLPMAVVAGWIEAYQEHERKEAAALQKQLAVGPGMPDKLDPPHAESVYRRTLNKLQGVTTHRNDSLNAAAYTLFGLARANYPNIDDTRIEMDLNIVANAIGFDASFTKSDVAATIKSAKNAAKPLVLDPDEESDTSGDIDLKDYDIGVMQKSGQVFQQATMNSLQFTLQQALSQSKAGQLSSDETRAMVEKINTVADGLLAMTGHIESVSGTMAVRQAAAMVKERIEKPQWVIGLRSNLAKLDGAIGGFPSGQCYTFLGATGTGKTTMAATLAIEFAGQAPGMIVSCESNPAVFILRMQAYLSHIPFGNIRRGGFLIKEWRDGHEVVVDFRAFNADEKAQLKAAQAKSLQLMNNGTVLLPGGSPTPAVIKSFVRKHAAKSKWLILDSLNDIHLPYWVSEYEDVSKAAMTAEEIAVTHDLTVVNTVQIGRNTKGRAIKAPDLYDARGSGKVEEKAAVIIGMYNHHYHVAQKQIESKIGDDATYPPDTVQMGVLKLRDGGMGIRPNIFYRGGCGYYNAATFNQDNNRTANLG